MNQIFWEGKKIAPPKIVCIGRNYVEHIEELGNAIPDELVVFNKPNSSIGESLLSRHQEPLHFETELCFLVEHCWPAVPIETYGRGQCKQIVTLIRNRLSRMQALLTLGQ